VALELSSEVKIALKVISHDNGTYVIKLSSFPFIENSCRRARRDYKRSQSLSVCALRLNYIADAFPFLIAERSMIYSELLNFYVNNFSIIITSNHFCLLYLRLFES